MIVAGRTITLTHPEKVLFPDEGITKQDVIEYYLQIAPLMLPLLAGRPLMLQRFPHGIEREGFFQKEAGEYFPTWLRRVTVKKAGGVVHHLEVRTSADLVYLANQDTIAFHAWLSREPRLTFPDRLIFDLDPSNDNFESVQTTALLLRQRLIERGVKPLVMTTGSRGLHVVVLLNGKTEIDRVRVWAKSIADDVAREQPRLATTEVRKRQRDGRVYIDVARNAYAQTAVAPYSLRARPGAPIATPITWREMTRLNSAHEFTIQNIFQRRGNPWESLQRSVRPIALGSEVRVTRRQ